MIKIVSLKFSFSDNQDVISLFSISFYQHLILHQQIMAKKFGHLTGSITHEPFSIK